MTGAAALCACASLAGSAAAQQAFTEEPQVGTLLRLFTDSDRIAVRSVTGNTQVPVGASKLALHWNNERVRIPAVEAAPGTAEALDAITTASRPIAGNAFQDYVKIRNEMQGELSRGNAALDYYLSTESDYTAQQIGARWSRNFQDEHLSVSTGASFGWDAIEPLADDDTQTNADTRRTIHWNAVATRVVTPTTLVRAGVELNFVSGLQHNPYRNVYAGGTRVPERHPEQRERRDAFVRVSQYLPQRSSLKLAYRLYNDDWGIWSHEVGTRLSQYLTAGLAARWEYRWYTQNAADFHRDEYEDVNGIGGYRSGDYRMDRLTSHLFGAALDADLDALAVVHPVMRRLALRLSYERYFNSNNYSANILETGVDFRFQ